MRRRFHFGARQCGDSLEFRILAPGLSSCSLVLRHDGDETAALQEHPMEYDGGSGIFSCRIPDLPDAFAYALSLPDGRMIPDPFAAENQDGVHGWSYFEKSMLTPRKPDYWPGVAIEDAAILEIHIGAFSAEGTFKACREKLHHIAALGFNVIQLMPVWLTPGMRNWGYDPVSFFTINPCYGALQDFKDLIAAAHELGIAVVIDCVFNHLGPEGSYLPALIPGFLSPTEHTPWGDVLALEGPAGAQLRTLILDCIEYWFGHVGVDGMRVDAGEYLRPNGDTGFLTTLARHARRCCRHENAQLFLEHDHGSIAEGDRKALLTTGVYDRIWNFAVMPRLSTETSRFDNLVETLDVITNGALLRPDTQTRWEPNDFINFLRSHDTIGNAGYTKRGADFDQFALFDVLRLLLTAPTTPMVFMGDEWGAETPFHFFCNLNDIAEADLVEARRREFPGAARYEPSPLSPEAYHASKLNWAECAAPQAKDFLEDVRRLLDLRRRVIAPFIRKRPSLASVSLDKARQLASATWIAEDRSELHIDIHGATAAPSLISPQHHVVYASRACGDAANGASLSLRRREASDSGHNDERSLCLPA